MLTSCRRSRKGAGSDSIPEEDRPRGALPSLSPDRQAGELIRITKHSNASTASVHDLRQASSACSIDRSEVTFKRLDQMSEEELETFIGDEAPEEQGTRALSEIHQRIHMTAPPLLVLDEAGIAAHPAVLAQPMVPHPWASLEPERE